MVYRKAWEVQYQRDRARGQTRYVDAEPTRSRLAELTAGLAVRLRRNWAVRPLAMPSAALSKQIREPSWIRHALTAASWSRLLYTLPANKIAQPAEIGGPVVALARQLVERIPALRPDAEVSRFELNTAPEPFDKVLDSLTQFDALWCVMAVASSGRDNDQYPSFAAFYSHRAEPALELLITDDTVRQELLGDDVDNLKGAITTVVNIAQELSFQQRHVSWGPRSNVISNYLNH